MIKYLNIGDEIKAITGDKKFSGLHKRMYYKIIKIDKNQNEVLVRNKGYETWFNINEFDYISVARVNMIKMLLNG